NVELAWGAWFVAAAPAGLLVVVLGPFVGYWVYSPGGKEGGGGDGWAAKEVGKVGGFTSRENNLGVVGGMAVGLWIFAGDYVNPTTTALVVISLMVRLNVMTWDDISKNFNAWNTLAWFATLVALAGGLSQVGFVKWFAEGIASHMAGFTPTKAILLL